MTNDELILSLRKWFASQSLSLDAEDRTSVEHALEEPNLRAGWLLLNELQPKLPKIWKSAIKSYYGAVF